MPAPHANPPSYGSANDLPSVIEIRQTIKGLKVLSRIFARNERQSILKAERDLNALVKLVDRFYQTLGPRHWVFTDHLMPMSSLERLFDEQPTSEQAEEGLIEIIAASIESPYWDLGLFGHEAINARRPLIERARRHYLDRDWDSCALVLVTAMDGFVNDVETAARRGLHARSPEEMVAWDSVSGHHLGLTSVMREFQKPFYKRYDDEVYELYRHGIVHGIVINYNNQVVATKAWNMLAAVRDWAAAKEKSEATESPRVAWRSLWAELRKHADYDRYKNNFEPIKYSYSDKGFQDLPVFIAASSFLDSWQNGRWALVGNFLPSRTNAVPQKNRAVEAKRIFEALRPSDFFISEIDFPMASVATVTGMATFGQIKKTICIRWLLENGEGRLTTTNDITSLWILARASPEAFTVAQP